MLHLKKTERRKAKLKMCLNAVSGAGKTYGALLIAYGLTNDWGKIAVIDTENGSANLYSHFGDYLVLDLRPPFTPERYVEAMKACENAGVEVVIIDSISHEWGGTGGILDIHGAMAGNSFTNWKAITPRHNKFINAMLQTPLHIIATMRTKQDYVISEKEGKAVPEKVGLKSVQRDGTDYEFTLVLDLDIRHHSVASKDRTGLFYERPPFMITVDTGRELLAWCNNGTSLEEVISKINACPTTEGLRDIYRDYPAYQEKLLDDFLRRKEEIIGLADPEPVQSTEKPNLSPFKAFSNGNTADDITS